MTVQILIPIDYSELSKKALRTALSLHPDAEFTVLHVIDFRTSDLGPGGWGDSPGEFDEWLADAREHAKELMDDAEELATEYDTDIETDIVVGEDASRILKYVNEGDFDLIIMGSHGRSLPERIFLGGVSETVIRRAPIPVMVVR
ncbi:universal stress protein [Salinibaculum salinum]|uniref:universal stress protein n=1 Tax=Salinibaculum salinum TaxID=3131996 RepID=UPI0030EB8A87